MAAVVIHRLLPFSRNYGSNSQSVQPEDLLGKGLRTSTGRDHELLRNGAFGDVLKKTGHPKIQKKSLATAQGYFLEKPSAENCPRKCENKKVGEQPLKK